MDRDIDVQLTIVPHASGKEGYRQTLAKREAAATTVLSAWQVPGGPAIDSDGDGLPDLVELERGTKVWTRICTASSRRFLQSPDGRAEHRALACGTFASRRSRLVASLRRNGWAT